MMFVKQKKHAKGAQEYNASGSSQVDPYTFHT